LPVPFPARAGGSNRGRRCASHNGWHITFEGILSSVACERSKHSRRQGQARTAASSSKRRSTSRKGDHQFHQRRPCVVHCGTLSDPCNGRTAIAAINVDETELTTNTAKIDRIRNIIVRFAENEEAIRDDALCEEYATVSKELEELARAKNSDAAIQANALQKRRMAVEEALLTMIEGYQPE
jgi:hypothetical protein